MIVPLLALAAAVSTARASLLEARPDAALVDETVELRPAPGHHFNVAAPQRCGRARPVHLTEGRLRCQFRSPGQAEIVASVCDDAKTFCRRERVTLTVAGVSRRALESSPMLAAPPAPHPLPEGFTGDLAEAAARARREGKRVFIHFYAPWCPPCNQLQEQTYPTAEFRAAAAGYVLAAVDADAPASASWKERFKVGGYPTLIAADARLRELDRLYDYRSGPSLARFLREALSAEPFEESERLARGKDAASLARRLRAARWRAQRGEAAAAERLAAGLPAAEARRVRLEARVEVSIRDQDDAALAAAEKALASAAPAAASVPAEEVLRDAVASPAPATRAAALVRAYALTNAGRLAEARPVYEDALKRSPDDFALNFYLGRLLRELGEPAAALPHARKAVARSYGDNWLRAVADEARTLRDLGRREEARALLDEALSLAVPSKTPHVRTVRFISDLRTLRRELAD